MRLFRMILAVAALTVATGCHSAFVDATVSNRTANVIPLIEVDYPSASFGTEKLAPGKDFHYRFKVLGEGVLKVVFTDSAQHEQTAVGPALHEGDEGPLTITFAADGIHWQTPPPKH